jgi:hypothetical protein
MQVKVELLGDLEVRKALRAFTPDLEKALRKEIGAALRPVVREAKGFVPAESPMRGWASRSFNQGSFPTFSSSVVKAGITYSSVPSKINKDGFRSMASVLNKSRAGSIYESAGRKNPQGQPWVGPKGPAGHKYSHSNNPQAGKQFIDNLPPLVGSLKGRGRLIYRAWRNNQGKAEGAVNKAVDQALTQFRARAASGTLRRAA